MALDIRVTENFDINTGETLTFRDLTGLYNVTSNPGGYGGPNLSINAVNKVRLVWASYLTEQAAPTSTEIEAGREYIVSMASLTFNGKTYTVGQSFISMIDVTPTLGNSIITETGRFSSLTDFLPVDVISSDFTPSFFGINDTIFPDSAYIVTYELYDTVHTAGSVTVSGSTQFIVKGTPGQTVTISGAVWYPNEIVVKVSNFSFTGTASLVEYATEKTDPFFLSYYAWASLKALNLRIVSSCGDCQCELQKVYDDAYTDFRAVEINYQDVLGLSSSLVQSLLESIVTKCTLALNCNC